MDPYQCSVLEKLILDLLEPGTTPEKALQLFSSPCFSPYTYGEEDTEPVMIFYAYIRFITMRLPDACVVGIWEDILRKTVLYSKHISASQSHLTLIRRISSRVAPMGGFQIKIWLNEALSTHSKCPNPFIRLELFRLFRILDFDLELATCEHIWATFRYTICEIQPYHLYPCDEVDEPLFGIEDLEYILSLFGFHLKMHIIISNDTMNELAKKNELYNKDNEIRFICHCIRLIGIFAMMADTFLLATFNVLELTLARIIKFEEHLDVYCITKEQFREILSLQPFRHFMIETVRDVTKAVLNHSVLRADTFLMAVRARIFKDLGVCASMSDLPRLLLSYQAQSPMIVRQHSLLLEVLDTKVYEMYRPEENSNIEEDFDRYLQI